MGSRYGVLFISLAVALFFSGCAIQKGDDEGGTLPAGRVVQETFVHPDIELLEQQQKAAEGGRETWRLTSPERVARLVEPDLFRILPGDQVKLKELSEDQKKAIVEVFRKGEAVAEIELARYRNEVSGVWFIGKVKVFITQR